jgi:hypothetical protein
LLPAPPLHQRLPAGESAEIPRHTAPHSIIVPAEAMLDRARGLVTSHRAYDLAIACVLAIDVTDLLAGERSSISVDAMQLHEQASVTLELQASSSDADLNAEARLRRIYNQLGATDDTGTISAGERLRTRMQVLTALRRIYTANDQLRGSESCTRAIAQTQREIFLSRLPDLRLWRRSGTWLRWFGTWYVDKATDSGLSILRLLTMVAVWWIVIAVILAITFIASGVPIATAAAAGLQHAAVSLFAYPGPSGAQLFEGMAGYASVAASLKTDCILLVSSDCRVTPGTVYTLVTATARIISLLHLSLIASILFRKILRKG